MTDVRHVGFVMRVFGRPTNGISWTAVHNFVGIGAVGFGLPFVKRLALCYRTVVCLTLSVLSVCLVCDVGILWPNGWMDQGETWHGGRPRHWPHCVGWEPSFPINPNPNPVTNFW